jgi:hypothetical protein
MTKEQSGPRGFQMSEEEAAAGAVPEMSFTTLVLSLSTSALVHMGQAPLPDTDEAPEPNLPLAKQTIDILEILAQKTKGNLEADEKSVLEQILHQLHLAYVEARKG